MIAFRGRVLLFDIEGTVSPLAFVHRVMFPYARERARDFLAAEGGREDVKGALEQMAADAGAPSFVRWCPERPGSLAAADWVTREVFALMDADAKRIGLKLLQGLIWEQGFHNGLLRATLFPDVVPAWRHFLAAGRELRLYSSGSVHAQRLFFAHTTEGDLTEWLSGCHDTAIGSKKEAASYVAIAREVGVPPEEILFVSDLVAELDAAREVGLPTVLAIRPGNPPVEPNGHPTVSTLEEIVLPE